MQFEAALDDFGLTPALDNILANLADLADGPGLSSQLPIHRQPSIRIDGHEITHGSRCYF